MVKGRVSSGSMSWMHWAWGLGIILFGLGWWFFNTGQYVDVAKHFPLLLVLLGAKKLLMHGEWR